MAFYKNTQQALTLFAVNSTNGQPVSGDSANITAEISKNTGPAAAATNSVFELSSGNLPGMYALTLTAAETNTSMLTVYFESSTTNVSIDPVTIFTTDLSQVQDTNVVEVTGNTTAADNLHDSLDPISGLADAITLGSGGSGSGISPGTYQMEHGVDFNGAGLSGTGLIIDVTFSSTAVTGIQIVDGGEGYSANQTTFLTQFELQAVAGGTWFNGAAFTITSVFTRQPHLALSSEIEDVEDHLDLQDVTLSNLSTNTGTVIPGLINNLNDPSAQDVASEILDTPANKLVTNATGQVEASNMRGTDNAALATSLTSVADSVADVLTDTGDIITDVTAVLADTDELQSNQGDWATADVSSLATSAQITTLSSDVSDIDNTVTTIDSRTTDILTDTNELQTNQGDWATANVSTLLTTATYTASLPANFSTLIIGTGADAGKVTTSNPASGGGSAHTAQDVANLILAGDQSPIITASGAISNVDLVDTTTNLTNGGTGGDSAATIYTYFTSGNNEDAFKADIAALATAQDITDLEVGPIATIDTEVGDLQTDLTAVKAKTDQLVFSLAGRVDSNPLSSGADSAGGTTLRAY